MPKQILLVDDSVTIHRVVEITFGQEDFAVTAVKTLDEGLDRARQLKPDIILADSGLPAGKSGYDLCTSLRQDATLARTACLILTGNFSPYDEARGTQAGADGFVVKPFETQALIDKVKDAIVRRSGGEVAAPRPVATAPIAAVPVPAKAGIESLSKPLSIIAAETSARIPAQVARPASLPVPQAPVAAPPVVQAAQRPQPKATLMGIPAVNPAAMGITAPTPAAPPAAASVVPHSVLSPPPKAMPAPVAAAPVAARVATPIQTPTRAAPVLAPPPAATPAPAAPQAHAAPLPNSIPSNTPQMPRPSLVPGVAAPKPVAAKPAVAMDSVVRDVAERASQAVPAAIAKKGPEYEALAKLSREVIEQIVWEVVPELAETIIRAELDRLVRERQNA